MKLRNKKTGIIGELHFEPDKEYHFTVVTEGPADVMIYKKLAALYTDWEDYEEPKEYWMIDTSCLPMVRKEIGGKAEDIDKEIGNYFNTREEAEKAIEKLKAWKRLKDKGFRFKCCDDYHIDYELTGRCAWTDETEKDLDLLFGGEE